MIEKLTMAGHEGYVALNEEKRQGVFCWWNERFGKVVLYEIWRDKNGDTHMAYGRRKSKSGQCQKNINFIPVLAEEVIKIIGLVAGVEVSPKAAQVSAVEDKAASADLKLKKDIRDLGV